MDTTSFTSPDVGTSLVVDALAAAGFDVGRSRSVARTLLDTFDGRLHAAGLRLELHHGRGSELVLTGGGVTPAHLAVDTVPQLSTDIPAGPLRARLAPVLDVRAVQPVLTLTGRVRTATHRDHAGKARAHVSVYEQLVADGDAVTAPSWVAVVEALAGYPKDAERAHQLLASLGLPRRDGDVLDAVAAAVGTDLAGFNGSPTVALRADEQAQEAFRRVLTNLAVAVDANWKGTVLHVDPEFLHDLRVAVRRTRSVLAQGKRVLPDRVRDTYRDGFGWLGTATGPARDLDVYMIEWDGYVAPLAADARAALAPVLHHLGAQRTVEHRRLAKVLRSARYRSLVTGWRRWLEEPATDVSGRDASRPIGPVAADRIGRAQAQLLSRGRSIGPTTAAEELHELRKDAKKLRYLLECLGGLYAPAPRKVFVQRLKALQDNLGEHQDTEVHVAELRRVAHDLHASVGADTMVAMGQLTEHLESRRRGARAEFAERFATYDTAKTAGALETLLASKAAPGR